MRYLSSGSAGNCKVSIGSNSNQNIIIQNSQVNNLVLYPNAVDTIKILRASNCFEGIQRQVQDMMAAVKEAHPLYPVFSVSYDSDLDVLVSTPETADAFKRYPKNAKGSCKIDYSKYPHMNRAETPWEYAYRTQTFVELETTAYQEYLGDTEDPFPVIKHTDGMTMKIGFPEFPPAVHTVISSGDVKVPCEIRRKPWLEYEQMCFGTASKDCGLDIKIITYKDLKKIDIKLEKEYGLDLRILLQREKLLAAMYATKRVSIAIDDLPLLDIGLSETDLEAGMFRIAKQLIRYYEGLLKIEERLHCRFEPVSGEASLDDLHTALALEASLDGKWYRLETDFDDEIHCDYDCIPDDISDFNYDISQLPIEGKVLGISLQGLHFTADKYTVCYQGARVNNIDSVMRNKKKRRKGILITFKPENGKKYFYKFCRFDGLKVVGN